MKTIEELETLKSHCKETILKCYPCASKHIEQLIFISNLEQRAIDIEKACEWLRARNVLTDASLQGFKQAMYEND